MQNYLIINHSNGTTPRPAMEDWRDYFGAKLAGHIVDGGKPIPQKTVIKEGEAVTAQEDTVVSYYIIKASSMDEAIELTKKSPLANRTGCEIRIYETGQM